MEFSPYNPVVKRCIQGMEQEEKGRPDQAHHLFRQAWEEATKDFEKFMAAFYVARHQQNVTESLKWLQTTLALALKVNSDSVQGALPLLYLQLAKCYDELGETQKANKNKELAVSSDRNPEARGPFYHGTKADLRTGDLLKAGKSSNYKEGIIMNHIYFTALVNGAGLAAALAKAEGRDRVYIVEPTGDFENDPNVTNKKFPGNPSRSYRSLAPLKVIGEVTDWERLTPEQLRQWREKLAGKGEIIN